MVNCFGFYGGKGGTHKVCIDILNKQSYKSISIDYASWGTQAFIYLLEL